MKHMKQLIALLVALVVCLGLLAGCASKTTDDTTTPTDTTPAIPAMKPDRAYTKVSTFLEGMPDSRAASGLPPQQ